MPWEAWLTLATVVVTVAALASERISAPYAMVGAVTFLLVAGVIDTKQAFEGFANPAPISVAALYVLAGAAERTGVLEHVTLRLLGRGSPDRPRPRRELTRLLLPTAVASAFLNNTPIVAMLAPAVLGWARRTGRAAAKYLMPISFATILGGILTLIGTSTNLVVSGLLERDGAEPLGMFELARASLPAAIAGLVVLIVLGPRLLPDRKAPGEDVADGMREFTVELVVQDGSPLAGQTVSGAGLRNLQGVFLVEIERDGRRTGPVPPDEVLAGGDRLVFAGNVTRILDLQRTPGLLLAEERHFDLSNHGGRARFFEVVVSGTSTLVGRTMKEVGFRSRFGAAVIAIHRAGERIPEKLGDIALRPGDVLLVLADSTFRDRWSEHQEFLVVAPLGDTAPLRRDKARVVALVTAGLLTVVSTGLLEIVPAAMVAAVALVTLGVLTPSEARDSIDANVIVLIGASFGLGAAMAESGLAERLARVLVGAFDSWGDIGLLAGILFTTTFLTEIITNNAAAALMFPIAIATATQAGLQPRPFAVAIAVGASASFLTPIGYQTNTMVYGLGGYRFGDFVRVGGLVTVAVLSTALVFIPMGFPLR